MTGFIRSGMSPKDQDGSHRFPGCPNVPLPCSWTPVGPNAPHLDGARVLSPLTKARRLQHECISRLDHTASVLAVYASCRPLGRRRKTRFRWVVSLSGWDCITHWATAGSFGLSASPPSGLFLSRFVGNFVANFVDEWLECWDSTKFPTKFSPKTLFGQTLTRACPRSCLKVGRGVPAEPAFPFSFGKRLAHQGR
jgi:hypothetical protein